MSNATTYNETAHEQRDRELFDSIAEEYCRKDQLPATRIARKCRLTQTLRIAKLNDQTSLLEVGCGAGFAPTYLNGNFGSFCGVDYSQQLIQYANQFNAGPHTEFVTANIKDFDSAKKFDLVFAIGLLHHLDDLQALLEDMKNMLNPGGWLIANEPQPANPLISLARKIRKKVDSNYSSDQRELSAKELREAYQQAGLVDIKVIPQGFFSTPFAEVPIKPQLLMAPFAALSTLADKAIECLPSFLISKLSWNLVIAGRRPAS